VTVKQENIAVEKDSAKKFLVNFLWVVAFCGSLFGGYKAISQENVLPIKEISISGEFDQISAQELHSLIVDGVSGNFFTLSVENLYQKFYALPWVEQIWVHRVWPDKINIEIRENKAVAILKDKGLLNDKGRVFSTNATHFKNILPLFAVASEYEQEAITAYRVYEEILGETGVRIRQFIFDRRKSQTLFLSNELEVKLGRVNTEKRLGRFIKAYEQNLAEKVQKIEGVDLRYTNGFAVKWKHKLKQVSVQTTNKQQVTKV